MKSINGFWNEWRGFSNFADSPVHLDGVQYRTVEHAYQAAKTNDQDLRDLIRGLPRPHETKRLGNQIAMRPDWDHVKPLVMLGLLTQKFMIPEYEKLLLSTGDAYLEETNTWKDVYWGVCDGQGLNMLGKQLMYIRELLNIKPS
jgi:ribA/ribD-fused uncharacterized protein